MLAPYLHHTLIHFPIAFLTAGAISIALSILFRWQALARAGAWCLLVGVGAGILAAVAGFLSMDQATARGVSEASVHEHRNIAIAALVIGCVGAALWMAGQRKSSGAERRLSVLAPGLAIATAGLVGWSAHVGGTMVHPQLGLKRILGLQQKVEGPQTAIAATPPATFTKQVERGAALFAIHCVECHGDAGQGGELAPALVGGRALADSEHYKTAAELLDYVEHNMPALDPGSLDVDEYRSVTAWLLAQNGYEPLFDRNSAPGIEFKTVRTARGPE